MLRKQFLLMAVSLLPVAAFATGIYSVKVSGSQSCPALIQTEGGYGISEIFPGHGKKGTYYTPSSSTAVTINSVPVGAQVWVYALQDSKGTCFDTDFDTQQISIRNPDLPGAMVSYDDAPTSIASVYEISEYTGLRGSTATVGSVSSILLQAK